MSRYNSGKWAEGIVRDSLNAAKKEFGSDIYWRRISDTHSFQKQNAKIVAPKQPADFEVVFRGCPIYIEVKSSRCKTSYNFDYIKDHQWQAAKEITNAGGIYLFVLINAKRPKSDIYLLFAHQLKDEKDTANVIDDSRSAKWVMFKNYKRKFSNGIFDLKDILKKIMVMNG